MDAVGMLTGGQPPPSEQARNRDVARRIAARGTVLLKNSGRLLPLNPAALRTVAVIGHPAELPAAGSGSSFVQPTRVVSLSNAPHPSGGGWFRLSWVVPGSPEADPNGAMTRAVNIAKTADGAIVAVADAGGENADRANLLLPGSQDALVSAVAAANRRTVVVLCASGPVLMNAWLDAVPTLLAAWYPGQEGALALADILLGELSPSGSCR